jgi:hypothetical protein
VTDKEHVEPEEDGPEDEEGAFWKRHGEMLEAVVGKHLTEDKFEAALDKWAAKQSAAIDQEEEAHAPKAPNPDARSDRRGSESEGAVEREPSDAERQREAGRVGRGAPSTFYERKGRRWLYGK